MKGVKKTPSRAGGPRSEVSILLPGAMILLVLLSSFALFSYRSTLELLADERRTEAEAVARRLAVMVAQEGWATSEILRQRAPGARRVAVLDAAGWPVLGDLQAGGEESDTIAGEAPFQAGGRSYRMRVDLPAGLLLGKQRSLEVLIPWILFLDAALLGLVFLSMRRLLLPIDELLEKARLFASKDTAPPAEPDEVRFLSSTFDRAVEEIAGLTEAYRRSREERLAESLRQLGELTAGVAHEMRNSIATLKGYVALIDRDPERRMLDENLAEIRREGDHLHRVLEDFLSFARPGSVRLAQVDLRQTLVRAVEDPALGGQTCRLAVQPGSDWNVAGDGQLLERALRNLLHNAAAAQERAGRTGEAIEVSLTRQGELIEIAVKDRGEGIPEELLPRLFEPFAAGHPKGVGLGLALTRRILLLHGGSIEIESGGSGGGTTVRVELPAADHGGSVTESSAVQPAPEPASRPESHSKRRPS